MPLKGLEQTTLFLLFNTQTHQRCLRTNVNTKEKIPENCWDNCDQTLSPGRSAISVTVTKNATVSELGLKVAPELFLDCLVQ